MLLSKGSMEISMYPVTFRLIQKFFTKRVHGNFYVPSSIKTNSKMLLLKRFVEISMYPVILRLIQIHCTCNSDAFFLAMVQGYFHVCNITVK